MNFLILFIILSVVNVVFSTIRSIVTIKGGKVTASLISGGYFAFYNIMLIYTVADFPMWQKCLVTFFANVVGVFVVKWGEEKARKDKLWKIDCTIPTKYLKAVDFDLYSIPHSYIKLSDKHTVFTFYCATQADTQKVKDITSQYDPKYFVTENHAIL